MSMRIMSTANTSEGIHWYYEQEGSGPDVVLMPDGLGECEMFSKSMTRIATKGFRVTTFDMPGLSRSADAPVESYTEVTAQKLARYVMNLLDHLKIEEATFWGCSSGGATVLALCKEYPERVRNAMVHEVPTKVDPVLLKLADMSDEAMSQTLDRMNRSNRRMDKAWNALESEALARVKKNYPVWARGYTRTIPPSTPIDELEKVAERPLFWSVGSETSMSKFFDNVVEATKADIEVGLLPGGHLVYLSHPIEFAEHVVQQARRWAWST